MCYDPSQRDGYNHQCLGVVMGVYRGGLGMILENLFMTTLTFTPMTIGDNGSSEKVLKICSSQV